MSRPRVAIVVDHPQRDLPGLVHLGVELVQRDIEAALVPLNLIGREIWATVPDLVLLNFLRPGIEPTVRRLVANGTPFGVLDTEGLPWNGLEHYVEPLTRDPVLRHAARFVCMWGTRQRDFLVSGSWFTEGQLVVTGCPRFDLYRAPWSGWQPAGGHPARPRGILINTSFNMGNPRFSTVEEVLTACQRDLGWTGERASRHLATERQALEAMCALARRLRADVPGVPVVLRPHPFEDPAPYASLTADGVELNLDGTVGEQLLGAAVVIQRSCLTAVDAASAGVPTLSPRWITPAEELPVAESLSEGCATYEALRDRTRELLAGGVMPAATRMQEAEAWLGPQDGAAATRVADVIERALAGAGPPDRRVAREFLYRAERSGDGRELSIGSRLRQTLRLAPDWSFRRWGHAGREVEWFGTPKAFTQAEVRAIADGLLRARAAAGLPHRRVAVVPASDRAGLRQAFGASLALQPGAAA